MDSDRRPTDEDKIAAVRTRMAQHALFHPDGFDLRTGIILRKNGVLRGPIETFRPPDELLAIVRDDGHPARIQTPPGPLVAHKAKQEGEAALVVTVAEFLYADDPGVRGVAVEHLEALAAAEPPMLTHRARGVLARERARLLSANEDWQVAAVTAIDAVEDDYLYNLAALRQCVALGYRAGAEAFGPLVLRPPLTALTALEFATEAPSQEHEKIGAALKRCAEESASIERLCQEWYRRFGHLPLAAHLALGKALEEWRTAHGHADSPWEAVWRWADGVESPLARYHACQVFVAYPALIPEGKRGELWKEIVEIVSPPPQEVAGLKWSQAWRLRAELLGHYAAYFECVAPGEDSERTANLALWAAEQAAAIYGTAQLPLGRVIEQTIAPAAEVTREIWQLTRPPVRPSVLRFATHFTPSIWALAVLSELGGNIWSFVPEDADRAGMERVRETLTVGLMLAFPLSPPTGTATYAFEPTLQGAATAWADGMATVEAADTLRQMVECNRHLGNSEQLVTELRGVARSNEVGQYMIARSFRTLAYLDALPLQAVRECVWDQGWRRELLSGLTQQALNAIWDGMADLQMQHGGEWSNTLPHFWASLCEEGAAEDRRRLLFALTALSCLSSGSTSALRRLLHEPGRRFAEDASVWRARCEDALRVAPPWPAAKLRALLAELGIP
jgi:hypothetical protein